MNCTTHWPIRVRWGLVLLRLAVSLLPLSSLCIHGGNLGQVRTTCLVHLRSESECDILLDAQTPKPRYARAKLFGPEYGKLLIQVHPFLPLARCSYLSFVYFSEKALISKFVFAWSWASITTLLTFGTHQYSLSRIASAVHTSDNFSDYFNRHL